MTFKARRGRPLKFTRPARTITVTLPEDVLSSLAELDSDMGRAIVRLTMAATDKGPVRGVEVATFGSRAVIVVPPTKALRSVDGVELIPLSDGRALISIADGMSADQFELAVGDLLADGDVAETDQALLTQLLRVLQEHRHGQKLTVRRVIVLRAASGAAAATPDRRARSKS